MGNRGNDDWERNRAIQEEIERKIDSATNQRIAAREQRTVENEARRRASETELVENARTEAPFSGLPDRQGEVPSGPPVDRPKSASPLGWLATGIVALVVIGALSNRGNEDGGRNEPASETPAYSPTPAPAPIAAPSPQAEPPEVARPSEPDPSPAAPSYPASAPQYPEERPSGPPVEYPRYPSSNTPVASTLRVVERPGAAYPPIARQARIEGDVRLSVTVAPDGSVERVQPLGGNPALVDAAVAAVKRWRYEPYRPSGDDMGEVVTIQFRLNYR